MVRFLVLSAGRNCWSWLYYCSFANMATPTGKNCPAAGLWKPLPDLSRGGTERVWLYRPSRHERVATRQYDGAMKYVARRVVSTTHGEWREKSKGVVERLSSIENVGARRDESGMSAD